MKALVQEHPPPLTGRTPNLDLRTAEYYAIADRDDLDYGEARRPSSAVGRPLRRRPLLRLVRSARTSTRWRSSGSPAPASTR